MKQPLVSVIVPIFNVEKYLKKCVDSVISQTYKNIEIILVDDGSTDRSGKMADEYGKKYKNIIVIHQKNGGLSSARNTGIKRAHGQWIAFIDSDDYIANNYISELLRLAESSSADIATCSFESFSDDDSTLKKSPTWPNKALTGREAINDMMKNKRPAYIWLNLFNSRLFKEHKIEFPEGKEYEDLATKIKLLYNAKKVAYTNRKLYFYLIRKNSITGKKFSAQRYSDFVSALKDIRKFLAQSKHSPEFIFLNYFEFYSLIILLNYLAREQAVDAETKDYWHKIRKKLKCLYRNVKFPNIKAKVLYSALFVLSSNRMIYSALFRKVKK